MLRDPFAVDTPVILPSILSADLSKLGSEIDEIADADAVHVDVMDGNFVTNLSFGQPIVKAARRAAPEAYLDCHLMVTRPEELAGPIVEAGASGLTFHAELADNVRRTLDGLYDAISNAGVNVGVAINPLTPAEAVFPILERVRLVLVMSVVPGYSGQTFMPEVLRKVEAIKQRMRPDQRIEIDGGIDTGTIKSARDAGVDWFVAATAIYGQKDRREAIANLRQAMA